MLGLSAPVTGRRGRAWPYRPDAVAPRVAAELAARHPALRVESVRLAGAAAPALLFQSRDAEMIVLGARGEWGCAGLSLGSTAPAFAGDAVYLIVLVPSRLACTSLGRRPDKVTLAVDTAACADGDCTYCTPDRIPPERPDPRRVHPRRWPTRRGPGVTSTRTCGYWRTSSSSIPRRRSSGPRATPSCWWRGEGGGSGLGRVAYTVARHTRCPLAVVPA
ncbi:hypothetical protein ACH4TV_12835 [Streptomyces sp. NPDC020898]|uniref:hypothetical protein n=1 Tax=Streptomyces sp. NPDC020898 TaxID=3365101 RepID=UPI00379D5A1F